LVLMVRLVPRVPLVLLALQVQQVPKVRLALRVLLALPQLSLGLQGRLVLRVVLERLDPQVPREQHQLFLARLVLLARQAKRLLLFLSTPLLLDKLRLAVLI
jgi:hypothetical protein